MGEPLITLSKIRKEFGAGDHKVAILKDIDLTIEAGEMVAIVGASGSGKSSLMNILGGLDQPTSGSYRVAGREVATLDADQLAALRREYFGFIFQHYHLLRDLTALGNVEVPAIYSGRSMDMRRKRARALLGRLGLSERTGHRPTQLSGGQQQRVSIARALMNDAKVILADEPTGALDSHSGQEVLRILDELHAEGRTVIIVTHDPSIAARAQRVIEVRDGVIIADRRKTEGRPVEAPPDILASPGKVALTAVVSRLTEAFSMALLAMRAHKLRTALTIGIGSVVSVVGLGEGAREFILADVSSLGSSTLQIFPGASSGDTSAGSINTLVAADADTLVLQPYVAGVTPTVSTSARARFGNIEANAQITGVGHQYFAVNSLNLTQGRLFDQGSVERMTQEVVVNSESVKTLFQGFSGSPIGQIIMAGTVPLKVVGVVEPASSFGGGASVSLYVPYTAAQVRFLGSARLASITVQIAENVDSTLAEQAVTEVLTQRHGAKDFYMVNSDALRATIASITQTLTLMISAIAVISLVVGGIGVMNIMLVSVSERVPEIGVRMAMGARQSDIMQQFLIEAVMVCLLGGMLGIGLAYGLGWIVSLLDIGFNLIFSVSTIVLAVVCSSLIGVGFGFLPARNASQLNPVVALSK